MTEGIVDAPPAEVWAAWTTSEGLKSWLAPQADIDLRVGGLMRAHYGETGTLDDPGAIGNQILSFEPERMLSIRVVRAPDSFPFRSRVGEMWTVLYLTPIPNDKTLLRIVGLGFKADPESQRMKAFFEQGNEFTLKQLQDRLRKREPVTP